MRPLSGFLEIGLVGGMTFGRNLLVMHGYGLELSQFDMPST
jgi:hypothetical protein